MTTQETMTKEQILEILNNVYRNHMTPGIATGIIHKQLSAERERAGKLVEALKFAFDEFEDLNLHRQAARIHETLNELKSRL